MRREEPMNVQDILIAHRLMIIRQHEHVLKVLYQILLKGVIGAYNVPAVPRMWFNSCCNKTWYSFAKHITDMSE